MPWLAAAAAIAPIVGGAIGSANAQGSKNLSEEYAKRGMAALGGVSIPEIEKQKLLYEMYQNTGQYNPQLEQSTGMNMDPSAMEGVQQQVDPRLQQMQMRALQQMAGVAESGMTPADMAAYEQARRGAASESQAKSNQILQQMQERGQGGSGQELLAKLMASQSGADRMQQAQLEQAKAAQAAKMQAIAQQASMATAMNSQQFGQASDVAKARDIVNQFNTQYKQQLQQRNVGSQNQAQQANLQNQQNLANMNTQLRNTQQSQNKGLYQQQFNNQMQLAGAQNGAAQQASNYYAGQAANTAGMYSTIGQGVGTAAGSYGTMMNNNQQNALDRQTYGNKG